MAHAPRPFKKFLVHPLQAFGAYAVYLFFQILPLDWSSAVGGFLGRTIGPRARISDRARANLRLIFPDKPDADVERIVRGMWDNLGRVAAEFPHLHKIKASGPGSRITLNGGEHIEAVRDDGEPGIFYSAHLGNWEALAAGAHDKGLAVDRVYREANNRMVEWLYRHGRAVVEGAQIPKGPQGVRQLLDTFKNDRHLAMLVDQKMNDGVPAPFFGRPAMTAPAIADLALRFDCPVVGVRVKRLKGARFELTAIPPIRFKKTGDKKADVEAALKLVNKQLEDWIGETPEQWLWLHNRWSGIDA